MVVDEAYSFVACLGRDEHYYPYVVPVGHRLHRLHVVFERQVGYDGAVHPAFSAALAEPPDAVLQYRVEVAHENHRHGYLVFDGLELPEELGQRHAVAQRFRGGVLYCRPVGHGVAERYSDFHHVDATALHCPESVGRIVWRRASGAEVE